MITFLMNRSNVITQFVDMVIEQTELDIRKLYVDEKTPITEGVVVLFIINRPTQEEYGAVTKTLYKAPVVLNKLGVSDRIGMLQNVDPHRIIHIPEFPNDYLVRREYGHANLGNPTRIHTGEEYEQWVLENPRYHILQKFIDTRSEDGLYWSGRIFKIGDKFFPYSSCASSNWNTNHYTHDIVEFHQGKESLGKIPKFSHNPAFWYDVRRTFKYTGTEIGMLDFSVDDIGMLVPWEISAAVGFEYLGGYKSDLTYDQLNDQQKRMINATIQVLEMNDA